MPTAGRYLDSTRRPNLLDAVILMTLKLTGHPRNFDAMSFKTLSRSVPVADG